VPEKAFDSGEFALFSDASVRGAYLSRSSRGKPQRRRNGPAMAAWIGWWGCSPTSRPTVAGQTYLGYQGTNRAEYLAAIHALHAVLAYVRFFRQRPTTVELRLDNECVVKTLRGVWKGRELARHLAMADEVRAALSDLCITVNVAEVSKTNRHHKAAHRLSTSAWDQVLYKTEWRPENEPPGSKPRNADDDDVPF
jgi:ribonuclease HI